MSPVMIEHELRTALAVIRGATNLMASPKTTAQQWDAAAILLTQGLQRLALVPGIDRQFWELCEPGSLAPVPTSPLAEAG